MFNIKEYRNNFNILKIEKDLLKKQLKEKNNILFTFKKEYSILLEVQRIIQEVAYKTQNEIVIYITDIINFILDCIPILDKPDKFEIEFTNRRNQIECDLFFIKDNKRMNPLLSSGGGLLDITSFALQIACWSLQRKKNNTLIFDEPFKNINDPNNELNLKDFIGEMTKKIADKLKLQIIIVGNNNDFNNIADKIFKVNIKNGISFIEV